MQQEETRQRDDEWYRLHLMGWEASEIASTYNVDKTTINRAIDRVRDDGSWGRRSARQRYADLIDEIRGGSRLDREEARKMYGALKKDKPAVAANYLRIANGALLGLRPLVPDQESLYMHELVEEVREKQEKIDAWRNSQDEKSRMALRQKISELGPIRSPLVPVEDGS